VSFGYRVEALSTQHDRTAFDSGVASLDHYLRDRVGQGVRRNSASPFVLVDGQGSIAGYYTLSAYGIHLPELPDAIARKLPRYSVLPGTLLGRLAVSLTPRGQNLGRYLLMDALYRTWRQTREIASVGLVAEALDDRAREFYLHYEFVPLLDSPNKLFKPMPDIAKAFGRR
jgi:predicted GNAT family N-acyltransferase